MNDDISISSGNIDLEANVLAISKSKNLRVCVMGDSMVNQVFHSMECLISHFNSDIQRVVHNEFYSDKYRMRLPGSIELSFPKTGSVLSFHGKKDHANLRIMEKYGKNAIQAVQMFSSLTLVIYIVLMYWNLSLTRKV